MYCWGIASPLPNFALEKVLFIEYIPQTMLNSTQYIMPSQYRFNERPQEKSPYIFSNTLLGSSFIWVVH